MILPSYSFIFIFLPAVVILYHIANSRGLYVAGKIILTLSSLLFYALLSPGIKGLAVLLTSAVLSYAISLLISKTDRIVIKKVLVVLGIAASIALLIYCRYLSYFGELLGLGKDFTAIVVPVGISYFTFSQIAYMVDTYRDKNTVVSLLDYLLFISFFPKITVGPIALTTEMIPQFNDISRKKFDYKNMSKGFYRFTFGLSKKLLLADTLGKFADLGYANIENLGSGNAILVILSYTLQIYFDFSGYCDMASGICLMLGFDLCENFDGPYHSLSINEFWKRWHISLTRFFRNYLYIPLGGNRKGKVRTYINTLVIFLVSGLWHGAATSFVIWGGIHGIGMIASKLISPFTNKAPKILRWFLTFSFVNISWVFFRAEDIKVAKDMLAQLFTVGFTPLNSALIATCIPSEFQLMQWLILKVAPDMTYYSGCAVWIGLVALGVYLSCFAKTMKKRLDTFVPSKAKLAACVILFSWSVLSLSEVAQFIYVNF